MSYLYLTCIVVLTVLAESESNILDGKLAMMFSVTNAPDFFGVEKDHKGKVESLEFVADDYQDIFTTTQRIRVRSDDEDSSPIDSIEIVNARIKEPLMNLEGKYKDLYAFYRNRHQEFITPTEEPQTTTTTTTTSKPNLFGLQDRFPGRNIY